MPRPRPVPLTILGGSDLKPGELPPEGADQHPLAAYKGVSVTVRGRPIIEWIVERYAARPELGPITIAGPRRVYGGLAGATVVDTDASVAENLRTAIEASAAAHGPGPIAITTCDVLPAEAELEELLADFSAAAPCAVWCPLVRAPLDSAEIGAFGWKPGYPIAPARGAAPVRVLPGHLAIVDPVALRLPLLFRLIDVAYRTRNQGLETRRSAMLRAVLTALLVQDLRHVTALRAPTLTWSVLRAGLGLARGLATRRVTRPSLERAIARIVLKARHRRRHPERGVRLPIVDALTLAEDVDTEEEAREVEARERSAG